MGDEQRAEVVSGGDQTVDPASATFDVLHLLEALAKAQSENETLQERVLFLTKQIEDLRSQPQALEVDYDVLAEKVVQRVQTEMPTPQLQKLDQIEDLLQMLDRMRTADDRATSGEGSDIAGRPDHETEVADQLHAIRDEIQRLSAESS